MKTIYTISAGFIAALSLFACSEWTTPQALDFERGGLQGSDRSDEYYAALREWKASLSVDENGIPNRSVTFGWFSDWSGVGVNMSNQLMGLPDSVDFVSLWGNWSDLNDQRKEDLRKVREIKGTKVLLCFIIQNIGDQLTPSWVTEVAGTDDNGDYYLVNDTKYYSSYNAINAYWGFDESDASTIELAIRKYARAILDTIAKYDYDGFDYDLEPSYGSAGNISQNNTTGKNRISILLDELSTELGPKSGTGKLLCVDGEPNILNPGDGELINYFILQAYGDSYYTTTDNRIRTLINNYSGYLSSEEVVGKTILTSNFESYGSTGGPTYTTRDNISTFQLNAFAQYYYPNVECRIGGIGAFRMVFDTNYEYYRQAMTTMHSYVYPWETE